jgi:hypothetical protein
MHKWILTIALIAALGLAAWGCSGLTRHLIVAVDRWGDAAPGGTLAKINGTLDAINAPCKDIQGDWVCGPLAQLAQTEKNVGILASRSAQQVQQTGILVTAVANNLDSVGTAVRDTARHLDKTADAGTGTLNAATATLGEGQHAIAAFQPLAAAYTQDGYDLDALLKDRSLRATLDNVAGMTTQGGAILVDFRQVADKGREDYLKPVKWYMQPIHRAGDIIDITAAVARHTP